MTADDVLAVLGLLGRAGAEVWVEGGWGVDALVGERTREHRDLDLAHRREQEPLVLAALAAVGFTETLDQRPVRFVVTHPDGRAIDLHPLEVAPDGSAVQASFDPERPFPYPAACFVTGVIGGVTVPCVSAEQQVFFHQGYPPQERDLHDLALLRRLLGTTGPGPEPAPGPDPGDGPNGR
ncbi:nucleotidyltransferase domain-containing protein [Streptomyces sp. NPDC058417]|uniref:nucleotidyltransferase domain-containing protein n=1 Tax=unclassified Streptomyces TaxID=2593676 RepID=UPI00364C6C3A